MRRRKKLDEKTLEMCKKEYDRVNFLKHRIERDCKEIDSIISNNNWMHYLDSGFSDCSDFNQTQRFLKYKDIIAGYFRFIWG